MRKNSTKPNQPAQFVVARLGGQEVVVAILQSNPNGFAALLGFLLSISKDDWDKVSMLLTCALTPSLQLHAHAPFSLYCPAQRTK